MKHIITDEIKKLGKVFTDNNFELRIVGGAVRDALLDKNPKDIDFCTDATPDEMIAFLEKAGWTTIPTGIDHGTISVLCSLDEPYEITTLRIDTDTDGRHASVDFTRDFKLDAERRDLTINAMSIDLEGNVYDYFDGQTDLLNQTAKFVGNPIERIQEDYLRILRYFRFQGRFDQINFDTETLKAIEENVDGLDQISIERVWSEMQKIITGKNVDLILFAMNNVGILEKLNLLAIPHLFENNQSSNPITVLASMFPMEKPLEFIERWKFSNAEKTLLEFLLRSRFKQVSVSELKVWLTTTKVIKDHVLELLMLQNRLNDLEELANWNVPVFPVTGKDLLLMGVNPGPGMGEMLNTLKQEWVLSDFSKTREELLKNV